MNTFSRSAHPSAPGSARLWLRPIPYLVVAGAALLALAPDMGAGEQVLPEAPFTERALMAQRQSAQQECGWPALHAHAEIEQDHPETF